jgi:putative redox protein
MDLISIERKQDNAFKIKVRNHEAVSEFNKADGGGDRGPSPTEYMVGSLGACIAMMVNGYCQRHGYRNGQVGVNMTYELADNPKRVGGIVVDLEIPRDVPPEKREAIRKVATLCPVHNTLEHPPKVDLEIV